MNFTSKRFIFTAFMTTLYVVLLFVKPDTAETLTPFAYALIAAYCGFESWKPSR